MKCYICNEENGTRENLVLDHQHITEIYRCVCDDCFKEVENGEYDKFSIGYKLKLE